MKEINFDRFGVYIGTKDNLLEISTIQSGICQISGSVNEIPDYTR